MKNSKTLFSLPQEVAIIFLYLLFFFNNVSAQIQRSSSGQIILNTLSDDGHEVEIPLMRDTVTHLKYFSAKSGRDTAYLSWQIQNMHNDGEFILYRSNDGKMFSAIATKDVFGSYIKNPVQNYFKDSSCGTGTKYYRLVYISSASEYLISEKVMVQLESESQNLTETKTKQ